MSQEIASYTQVDLPLLKEKRVSLTIKREELLFPGISGNKYRKLKYNIEAAKAAKQRTLLTFGGGFSNHIAATALAGKIYGFQTIGVIRGEELKNKPLNHTLSKAVAHGMKLHFVSRAAYKEKASPNFLGELKALYGDFYLLPEGGSNDLAVRGCAEIMNAQDKHFSYMALAVGTGATLAGVAEGAFPGQQILGFPALKGDFLQKDICNFTSQRNWCLMKDYHFGGYAKLTPELVRFINEFKRTSQVALDPIYTGKVAFGLLDLVRKDYFPEGSHLLMIHTGGLQALEGMNEKLKKQGSELLL